MKYSEYDIGIKCRGFILDCVVFSTSGQRKFEKINTPGTYNIYYKENYYISQQAEQQLIEVGKNFLYKPQSKVVEYEIESAIGNFLTELRIIWKLFLEKDIQNSKEKYCILNKEEYFDKY